jgi:hypothetical protein
MNMKEGGKINKFKVGKVFKNIGKSTASALLHYGLPATLGLAGEMVGGPAGSAFGAMAGDMIADKVGDKTGYGMVRSVPIKGKGLYKALSKVGIKKRAVINTAKAVGTTALKIGAEAVKTGLMAYGAPPEMMGIVDSMEQVGERAIQKGTVKGLKTAGRESLQIAKEEALNVLDKQLDNFPPEYRDIAEGALDTYQMEVKKQPRRQANPYASIYGSGMYSKTMRHMRGGALGLNLSNIAPIDSASMNPYKEENNEYMGYNPIKGGRLPMQMMMGGSFLPAGGALISQQSLNPYKETINPYNSYNPLRGGSFLPAGYRNY